MSVAEGLVRNEDGVTRCRWGGGNDLAYRAYHDDEWGLPVTENVRLFEKLALEGFQAGLSWLTILRKRDAFRTAFAGFRTSAVAGFTGGDVDRLLADSGIVRHRGKIEAAIGNARATLDRLAAQGIEPERPPYSIREGGSRLCFVRDPDQYRVELIERVPGGDV